MKLRPIVTTERRSKTRLDEPLPLVVRGSERGGHSYRFETIARNVSAGGLCAFAPRIMQKGERVSMRIRFARLGSKPSQPPEVSIRGHVVRVEERPDGSSVFAAAFLLS